MTEDSDSREIAASRWISTALGNPGRKSRTRVARSSRHASSERQPHCDRTSNDPEVITMLANRLVDYPAIETT